MHGWWAGVGGAALDPDLVVAAPGFGAQHGRGLFSGINFVLKSSLDKYS